MKNFDVIIIGGGPSGAMAGIELQRRGFISCIIDKASFPREKLCGGGLTYKTMQFLNRHCPEIEKDKYILGQTDKVDFYYHANRIAHAAISTPCFFTDRTLLDSYLIDLYKSKGGTLIENTKILPKHIKLKDNLVLANQETLSYKYLVGACGCSTLFTRDLGIKRSDYFCIETHFQKENTNHEPCRIYFGPVKNGYGWYFPKNNHAALGVGGLNSDKHLAKQAELFFKEATPILRHPSKGAFIPSGQKVNAFHIQKNAILVGDSAGFIDPVTGEGIYYALLSGLYAADAIEESTKRGCDLSTIYTRKCKQIKQNMKWGYFYHKLLYSQWIMPYFIRALQRHPNFVKYYLEEVTFSYHYNYKNFLRHYFTKVRHS